MGHKILLVLSLALFLIYEASARKYFWNDWDGENSDSSEEQVWQWTWAHEDDEMAPATHQQYCDDVVPCQESSWLICQNNRCACLRSSMSFDPSSQKCLAQVGERCKFQLSTRPSSVTKVDCIENSNCNSRGICTCLPDFHDIQGTCSPLKNFGDLCNSTSECSKNLHCNETCQCQDDAEWSSEGHCVGLAGQPCVDYHCTDNAICGRSGSPRLCKCVEGHFPNKEGHCVTKMSIFDSCTQNEECRDEGQTRLTCINGTCGCDPLVSSYGTTLKNGVQISQCFGLVNFPCVDGYCAGGAICRRHICQCGIGSVISKETGECVKDFGWACDFKAPCMDGLVCKEEKCTCRSNDQLFDPVSQKCRSKVDALCTQDEDCIERAQCIIAQNKTKGHCACRDGFLENEKGACDLGLGKVCSKAKECATSLVCVNGSCQCDHVNAIYNAEKGRCLMGVGGKCNPQACVDNANCVEVQNLKHKCACLSGFYEMADGSCEQDNDVNVEY